MEDLYLENIGILTDKNIYRNLCPARLVEISLSRGEGELMDNGALLVKTGKYTGRSANDKFIVDSNFVHDKINWGDVNVPISKSIFENLKNKIITYLNKRDLFIFDGFAGASNSYSKKFRIINELAYQNLFIQNLLICPNEKQLLEFDPDYTILVAPGFKCDPKIDGTRSEAAIMIDYESKMIIICGTQYCGEIKKSVFSTMNFVLPLEGVLPMHCSANMDPETKETALFFGLSGTGKTTLSADPNRILIGDDEHGWSDDGIFNIEGGCYAKCLDLDEKLEPEIFGAIKFGSVVENVVIDPKTKKPNYSDSSLALNSRVGYPIEYIPNASLSGQGGIPNVLIFLTCDSFGVLPPISRLTKEAAMYQFITGFTSKISGTEIGINEPVPTFSTLFGEPFMPLKPEVYANILGEKIEKYNTKVYLVNTGWLNCATTSSGKKNPRIKLSYTRAMVSAALNNEYDKFNVKFIHDDLFNLDIPTYIPNSDVPSEILNPINSWDSKEEFYSQANKLASLFEKNFETKYPTISKKIKNAGPKILVPCIA